MISRDRLPVPGFRGAREEIDYAIRGANGGFVKLHVPKTIIAGVPLRPFIVRWFRFDTHPGRRKIVLLPQSERGEYDPPGVAATQFEKCEVVPGEQDRLKHIDPLEDLLVDRRPEQFAIRGIALAPSHPREEVSTGLPPQSIRDESVFLGDWPPVKAGEDFVSFELWSQQDELDSLESSCKGACAFPAIPTKPVP